MLTKAPERGFGFVRNFLDCVRSRREPSAPMRIGFQACLITLLANISLKTGKRVRWDDAAGRVVA
jgi:hypothetical protein